MSTLSLLPDRPTDVTEMERSVDRSPGGAREETSLVHEVHETVRRLLQHIVFVSLLTLRLYMLPLLYVSHKLAVSEDPWYPASWNFVLHPGRTQANCTQCRGTDGHGATGALGHTLQTVGDRCVAAVRVIRSLYSFGKLIGQDPNVLPAPVPLLDAPDSAIDLHSEPDASFKAFHADPATPALEPPAMASQIYHAALLNGNTLDDILAAFEAEERASVLHRRRALLQLSPIGPRTRHLSAPSSPAKELFDRPSSSLAKGLHLRSSSIQTTPERMLVSRVVEHAADGPDESAAAPAPTPAPDAHESEPTTPTRATADSRTRIVVEAEGENQMMRRSPAADATCAGPRGAHVPHTDRRAASTSLKRCPTFVRRQSQAGVTRRSVSADKKSLAVLQERAAMSTPALALGSPTKRARLQRRVKVYQDKDDDGDE